MNDARGSIENLLYRYAELIDAGDYEGIGELFAHGSITDEQGNPMATGAEAVAKLYYTTTRKYPDGTPKTQHILTNALVEFLDDGTAECRSRFTVLQQTDVAAAAAHHLGRLRRPLRERRRRLALHREADGACGCSATCPSTC